MNIAKPIRDESISNGIGIGPLAGVFGSNVIMKILDFFITFREFDYSINEIAEYAGVSSRSVIREMPILLSYNILIKSRTIGRSQMFKLNTDSQISLELMKISLIIADINANITTE